VEILYNVDIRRNEREWHLLIGSRISVDEKFHWNMSKIPTRVSTQALTKSDYSNELR
jgi:hypothetical protein